MARSPSENVQEFFGKLEEKKRTATPTPEYAALMTQKEKEQRALIDRWNGIEKEIREQYKGEKSLYKKGSADVKNAQQRLELELKQLRVRREKERDRWREKFKKAEAALKKKGALWTYEAK